MEKEEVKIFNSRTEICKAPASWRRNISQTILYKLIDGTYDPVKKPHLDPKYVKVERIIPERAYMKNTKEEIKEKKVVEGIAQVKSLFV